MFTGAVSPEVLAILERFMRDPQMAEFRLVGGTALALLRGHRLSADLDLFTEGSRLPPRLEWLLERSYKMSAIAIGDDRAVLTGRIEVVKTDFVAYPYRWLNAALVQEGIRLASLEDIAAMKVAAIGQRGSKKDFFDIAELLDGFKLEQVLDFFRRKFPAAADLHYLQALTYFADAERDPDPMRTDRTPSWTAVKAKILQAVRAFGDVAH